MRLQTQPQHALFLQNCADGHHHGPTATQTTTAMINISLCHSSTHNHNHNHRLKDVVISAAPHVNIHSKAGHLGSIQGWSPGSDNRS